MTSFKELKSKLFYGVWNPNAGGAEVGGWMLYPTLEDAVRSEGGQVDVYELTPKRLGKFEMQTKPVAIPLEFNK